MKDLWREIRMLIVELLITLQLWIIPKDHPHAVNFISMMRLYLKTTISIDDESEGSDFCPSIIASDEYRDETEVIQMIDDCADREGKLTDWERNFISSLGDQADKHMMLSQKQLDALDRIWERVT